MRSQCYSTLRRGRRCGWKGKDGEEKCGNLPTAETAPANRSTFQQPIPTSTSNNLLHCSYYAFFSTCSNFQCSQAVHLMRCMPKPPSKPRRRSLLNHNYQVGDALVKLNVRYGGYLHGLKMFSPLQQAGDKRIFGPAYTVQMVDANDTSAPKPSQHFVDGVTKDSVVFISQPKNMYSACWGGLMSTRAKYLGAQGVVIDGNFRDLNEHREMGFPVCLVPANSTD